MQRRALPVLAIWAVLTAIGEAVVFTTDLAPMAASEEGVHIDRSVRVLSAYSVPVMAFVLAVVAYSVVKFRRGAGEEPQDGPPVRGSRTATVSWLVVTAALAALLFVNPGLTGLRALASGGDPDLTIAVEGVQWHWNVTYPNGATVAPANELVLPVDQRVRFEITARDVVHSFWIPAFRMKQDAVPGQTTSFTTTPTILQNFSDDPNMRAQCAELCGTGHPGMRMAVRVVEPAEFAAFLATLDPGSGGGMDMPMGGSSESGMSMPTEGGS